jgi:histidine triad (HIT) family protein
VYAFRDIAPVAKTHIIIIPKERNGLTGVAAAQEKHAAILGHMMLVASKIAQAEGLEAGYRLVVNQGVAGCQSVDHIHLHLIGGQQLTWPPGTGKPEGSMTG